MYSVSVLRVFPTRCRWDNRGRLVHMAGGLWCGGARPDVHRRAAGYATCSRGARSPISRVRVGAFVSIAARYRAALLQRSHRTLRIASDDTNEDTVHPHVIPQGVCTCALMCASSFHFGLCLNNQLPNICTLTKGMRDPFPI
jgi:hypothetical protein